MKSKIFSIPLLLQFQHAFGFVLQTKKPNSFASSKHKRPHIWNTKLYSSTDDETGNDNDEQGQTNTEDRVASWMKFGAEDNPEEYWYNKRIHTLGNTGTLGALHAAMGPISTIIIDKLAYKGVDVRTQVSKELRNIAKNQGNRILDMCCGVGMSTRALLSAFHDDPSAAIVGLDTSPEMIGMARFFTRHDTDLARVLNEDRVRKLHDIVLQCERTRSLQEQMKKIRGSQAIFVQGNAEKTPFPNQSFDLVTLMYGLHEIPTYGRQNILQEANRILVHGGHLAIVDIASDYKPTRSMLAGEPYLEEYQQNIHRELATASGFFGLECKVLVPGHVCLWLLRREATS